MEFWTEEGDICRTKFTKFDAKIKSKKLFWQQILFSNLYLIWN